MSRATDITGTALNTTELQLALTGRSAIDQAIGILMSRSGVSDI